MTDKIACKYCGMKYHPRKIKKHELECSKDQKGSAVTGKPKAFAGVGIIRKCQKCGVQTEVLRLDGAKCKECGADL
jgi:DNA-directed RNA polymerase subunit RPC12/RpoP